MKLDHLVPADGHWLHLLVATPSEAYDAASALQGQGHGRLAARVLRGAKMRTTAALFDEVAAVLQFPPYFGENWDALDECLADLEWLHADACALTILDAVRLLDGEGAEPRRAFWEMTERVAREWGRPADESTARPVRAFRVVVQCTTEEEARLRELLPTVATPPGV